MYEEIPCLPLAGAKGLHLPFPSTPCWAAVLVFELFKFGGSSSEPVTDHALSYQALQVTGQHALTVLKADAQGSWDPSTKPVLLSSFLLLYPTSLHAPHKSERADIPLLLDSTPSSPLPCDCATGRGCTAAVCSSLARSRAALTLAAGTTLPSAQ